MKTNSFSPARIWCFAPGDAIWVVGDPDYFDKPQKRTGVMISKLGASKAISVGAYAYALSRLDEN